MPRTYYLVVCALHGHECYSHGYFTSRAEADRAIEHASRHEPGCGSVLTVATVAPRREHFAGEG